VGVVGFHGIDWDSGSTSIGYWIAEGCQGQGLVTLAVQALVDHAFSIWKLERAAIHCAPENRRSRGIPQRLGFREAGTVRGAERIGDRALDNVVYSMLARDWQP
jgi:ribosomal-protein-serine acetyltransferase